MRPESSEVSIKTSSRNFKLHGLLGKLGHQVPRFIVEGNGFIWSGQTAGNLFINVLCHARVHSIEPSGKSTVIVTSN